jgi:hypothetical protein
LAQFARLASLGGVLRGPLLHMNDTHLAALANSILAVIQVVIPYSSIVYAERARVRQNRHADCCYKW